MDGGLCDRSAVSSSSKVSAFSIPKSPHIYTHLSFNLLFSHVSLLNGLTRSSAILWVGPDRRRHRSYQCHRHVAAISRRGGETHTAGAETSADQVPAIAVCICKLFSSSSSSVIGYFNPGSSEHGGV